ncbi:MAG: M15 family metallopeptidase [Nocardioides sp.]|nr:M15 family metallopeptidase [Nocardioides sp.]MDO9455198.1 M15 family metallopeptidase [Nocardioides sp.]
MSRVSTAAAVAVVLLASACTAGPLGPDDPDTPGATDTGDPRAASAEPPSPSASTATTATDEKRPGTLDPAFAVDPPGPRTQRIGVADIMITAQDTLDPDLVEQVSKIDGVIATTTISLANVPMENKVYNLAAVDPASYRLFTSNADFQEAWDRVAAGEVAVAKGLEKKAPIDEQGFLRLSDEDSGTVHVGSFPEQAEKIDLVVNRKRGEALGMVPDNAMLISTGQTAPESLRGPIARIVGDAATVQNLDAVARYGLDPGAFDSAVLVGDFADAVGVFNFTPIGGGRIAPDPAWVRSHIVQETVPILGTITCNKFLMPQLKAALGEIVQLGLEDKINPGEYAGCYYPRYIAGSSTLSNHSFGLALDLNVPGNQRGTVGEMDRGVVAVFKRWGFAWGGDWGYTDPMHFELSQLKAPG